HLRFLINNISLARKFIRKKIFLHLVGPDLGVFENNDHIIYHGTKNLKELCDFIDSLNGHTWGVVTLTSMQNAEDTFLIKFFDYLCCEIPILFERGSLTNIDPQESFSTAYSIKEENGLLRKIIELGSISEEKYNEMVYQTRDARKNLSWEKSLSPLI